MRERRHSVAVPASGVDLGDRNVAAPPEGSKKRADVSIRAL